MEAASCSAFLRAFSFCSSLLARSSARLLALARASSGKKQYRSQDKDSNIVCSTKNKIAYSHGGVPFKPLTVSRYPTNCVPRLMKCCIRGCRIEKTTEKVQGKKKHPKSCKDTYIIQGWSRRTPNQVVFLAKLNPRSLWLGGSGAGDRRRRFQVLMRKRRGFLRHSVSFQGNQSSRRARRSSHIGGWLFFFLATTRKDIMRIFTKQYIKRKKGGRVAYELIMASS